MRTWFILAMIVLCGCGEAVSKDRATSTLESAGSSDVKIVDQHGIAPTLYGCSKDDAVAFEAVASNPAGKRVAATVCCGLLLKSCTVRH